MHLRKYILATLLIFVLASCYREQDLDQYRNDELSNMLTLNSLVSADSTVQVAATKPYFFSDVHKGRTFDRPRHCRRHKRRGKRAHDV